MQMQPEIDFEDLAPLKERVSRYCAYIAEIGKRRFRTGMDAIDSAIRGVAPGEVMTIIAYSGTFKSALLQNLMIQNAEATNTHQLFFSMEMPMEKIFERELQMVSGLTGYEIEHKFKSMKEDELTKILADLKLTGSTNVLVCERPRLTVEQIGEYVAMAKQRLGRNKVGSIGVDYLGLMKGEGKTIFERMAELSFQIKDMAKVERVPVIQLAQVNRGYAASTGKEIEMDAAKGGGDIEAGADFMLGMYEEDGQIIAKLLKNRNGPANLYFRMDLDRSTLKFKGAQPYTPPKKKTEKAY